MAVVVNNTMINRLGYFAIGSPMYAPLAWIVHLYVNFRTPLATDPANLYEECSWPGYGPIGTVVSEWAWSQPRPVLRSSPIR